MVTTGGVKEVESSAFQDVWIFKKKKQQQRTCHGSPLWSAPTWLTRHGQDGRHQVTPAERSQRVIFLTVAVSVFGFSASQRLVFHYWDWRNKCHSRAESLPNILFLHLSWMFGCFFIIELQHLWMFSVLYLWMWRLEYSRHYGTHWWPVTGPGLSERHRNHSQIVDFHQIWNFMFS